MNKEQLDKINELVETLGRYTNMTNNQYFEIESYDIGGQTGNRINKHLYNLPPEVIKPALRNYCDKLKAELKELGYED